METIHYSRCRMVPTPTSLAFRLGLLDGLKSSDANVDVKLEFGDYDHSQDRYWVRHASNAKSIWARSRGADTHPIAFSGCESHWPVLVSADSPIASPADLRGKRILVPKIKGRLFDVERQLYTKSFANALNSAGLTLADVEVVDIEFERPKLCDAPAEARNFFEVAAEACAEQLAAGKADAITTITPDWLLQRFPMKSIYDGRTDPHDWARGEMRMLNASGALVREHRDVLVDIVARLLQAGEWSAQHSADVAKIVAHDIQMQDAELGAHDIDFEDWGRIDCSPEQVRQMGARKDYLLSVGAIDNDFSVEDWIDTSIMASARELLARQREQVAA